LGPSDFTAIYFHNISTHLCYTNINMTKEL